VNVAAFVQAVLGATLAIAVLWDAFETVLVPRRIGRGLRLTGLYYGFMWRLWRRLFGWIRTPWRREAWLGTFAPMSLLLLLVCWAVGLILAFALLQASLGTARGELAHRVFALLYMSGQTFFTLGFGDMVPEGGLARLLSVVESGMGFAFLGTVIGYLPVLYAGFSLREVGIATLDARAGSPPTAAEALRRLPVEDGAALAGGLLPDWERWGAQLLESHISYPLLAYYRSQHSNQSWLAAVTSMLDVCALVLAGATGVRPDGARATFAMLRHALVDVSQGFVDAPLAGLPDRLPTATLARLRERLAGTPVGLPSTPEYETRLHTLRLLYEPYAQALAAHLLVELPPFVHEQPRRDNWRGGPWDRRLGVRDADPTAADDHF